VAYARTMTPISRRQFLAVAGVAALAGCTSRGGSDGDVGGGSDGDAGGSASPTPTPAGGDGSGTAASSGVPTADARLPLPMSPDGLREEAVSGGPPKDGIPSIDDPAFVGTGTANYLEPDDPVFGVARDGAAKAYPQKILAHHEIVNDTLAGQPVSVSYCPLTGTVQGFERGGTTLGVSGRLINNNLVMYDRATEAWWPQMLATAIPGPWNEDPEIESLREFRLIWTTWERWRDQHPDTRILSTNTGHARNYNDDPYGAYNPKKGYYADDGTLFAPLNEDDRYHPKRVVMGARTPEGAAAFLKDAIRDKRLTSGEIGDTPVLAVHDARYDTAFVYENPDGATFERDGNAVVASDGAEHPPDELPLARIHTYDSMWMAWAGYYPETNVYE